MSCSCTSTASSARPRTRRTCSRRRCSPRGAGSSSSRDARRSAPGSTGSPPTARSTPCARPGAARTTSGRLGCPSRRAGTSRSGSSPTRTPSSTGSRTRRPGRRRATRPGRRSRSRSSSACSISRRSSARCWCCATCSGYRAAEVAEMLDTSEASVNSLLRRARAAFESAPAGRRTRTRAAPGLHARARPRRPLRRVGRDRRRRRHGRAADRRRVADDAAPPARVPGTRGDRRLPARRRGAPRRAAAAAGDARQRPAGVRVLPPGAPGPTSRRRTRSSC